MIRIFYILFILGILSSSAQANILCKLNKFSESFEISQGAPQVIPGGVFSGPHIYRPLVIIKIDAKGGRSVYANGCHRAPTIVQNDPEAIVIDYCLKFTIFRGAPYCRDGVCLAKLDLGWVNNDWFQSDIADAQCSGTL